MSIVFLIMLLVQLPLIAELRESSAPFISGDSFRAIADHLCDETASFNPKNVKTGDIIFLKTDRLEEFFTAIHPFIAEKYILITHNSDYPAPGRFECTLSDEKIIAWFGQSPTVLNHNKFVPIPIGIANRYWDHGNINTFSRVACDLKKYNKNYLLGINFRIETNPRVRKPILDYFLSQPYCTQIYSSNHESYLRLMAQTKFVIDPAGNSLDCHRTWEALYMGAIPIRKSSMLDELLKDLPVLIVNDWNEVTEEFLNRKYQEITDNFNKFNQEKIFFHYWKNLILGIKYAAQINLQ